MHPCHGWVLICCPSHPQPAVTAPAWRGCRSCSSHGRAAWPRGTRWCWSAEPSATRRRSTNGSGTGAPWRVREHHSSRYCRPLVWHCVAQRGTAWGSRARCGAAEHGVGQQSTAWGSVVAPALHPPQVQLVTTAERGTYSCRVFNLFHELWSQEVDVEIGEGNLCIPRSPPCSTQGAAKPRSPLSPLFLTPLCAAPGPRLFASGAPWQDGDGGRCRWWHRPIAVLGAVATTALFADSPEPGSPDQLYGEIPSRRGGTLRGLQHSVGQWGQREGPSVSPSVPAATDKVALLVGNMHYVHHKHLRAPMVDVHALSALLRQLDFKVVSLLDLRRDEMQMAVDEFLLLLDKGVYGGAAPGGLRGSHGWASGRRRGAVGCGDTRGGVGRATTPCPTRTAVLRWTRLRELWHQLHGAHRRARLLHLCPLPVCAARTAAHAAAPHRPQHLPARHVPQEVTPRPTYGGAE